MPGTNDVFHVMSVLNVVCYCTLRCDFVSDDTGVRVHQLYLSTFFIFFSKILYNWK